MLINPRPGGRVTRRASSDPAASFSAPAGRRIATGVAQRNPWLTSIHELLSPRRAKDSSAPLVRVLARMVSSRGSASLPPPGYVPVLLAGHMRPHQPPTGLHDALGRSGGLPKPRPMAGVDYSEQSLSTRRQQGSAPDIASAIFSQIRSPHSGQRGSVMPAGCSRICGSGVRRRGIR